MNEEAFVAALTLTAAGIGGIIALLHRPMRRMLADARSQELVKNFAGQWLGLRTLQTQTPEGPIYPDFDDNLRQAMRTETELFFESVLREGTLDSRMAGRGLLAGCSGSTISGC